MLADIEVLPLDERLDALTAAYIKSKVMPADAEGDAAHLAIASLHECDYLLTWNCKHLANANKWSHIRAVNLRFGLHTPQIVTPDILMGEPSP
jgi:hypothetical protein